MSPTVTRVESNQKLKFINLLKKFREVLQLAVPKSERIKKNNNYLAPPKPNSRTLWPTNPNWNLTLFGRSNKNFVGQKWFFSQRWKKEKSFQTFGPLRPIKFSTINYFLRIFSCHSTNTTREDAKTKSTTFFLDIQDFPWKRIQHFSESPTQK